LRVEIRRCREIKARLGDAERDAQHLVRIGLRESAGGDYCGEDEGKRAFH
jgi:hypothetical protein